MASRLGSVARAAPWHKHDVGQSEEFRRRYHAELDENPAVEELLTLKGPLTLVTASRDVDHSHAQVLRDYLKQSSAVCNATPGRRNKSTSTGPAGHRIFRKDRIVSDHTIERLNVDDSQVALQGYSPVSYLDDHVAEQGKPEHRVEHNGVVYYLTSSDQVARFQADPARYEPAFGGWCAFGMSLGKRFRIEPTSFEIVDGRLMVFLDDLETDARALWKQGDPAELASKAQQAWDDHPA